MSESGLYPEIVVSSRFRLSRNCGQFAFSHRLGKAESIALLARAERVFRKAPPECGAPFSAQNPSALQRRFVSADEKGGCLVNHIDHFTIWREASGLCLAQTSQAAHRIEALLEAEFPFAVNLEWGYLSPRLTNLGTAARISALLHLPALSGGMAAATLAVAMEGAQDSAGMELAAWGPPEAALFCLRNRETLGMSEQAIMNKLDALTRVLLHYEKELAAKRRQAEALAFDDGAWRAWAVLRHSRQIGFGEALAALNRYRLALVAGVFPADQTPGAYAALSRALGQVLSQGAQTPNGERADGLRLIFEG